MQKSLSYSDHAPQQYNQPIEDQDLSIFKQKIPKSIKEGIIEGKWQTQQNLTYVMFMDIHKEIFLSKEKRKHNKIFKTLSNLLETRTPAQCRSHFQKLMNRFKTLRKVLKFHRNEIGVIAYSQKLEQFSQRWSLFKEQTIEPSIKQEQKQFESIGIQTEMEVYPTYYLNPTFFFSFAEEQFYPYYQYHYAPKLQ